MKAIFSGAATRLRVEATWPPYRVEAKHRMSPPPNLRLNAQTRSGMAAYTANLMLCLSLWISLLAAIWLTRGWIGLLFSGQLFSVGARLFGMLSKRTQYALAAGNVLAREFEADRNE